MHSAKGQVHSLTGVSPFHALCHVAKKISQGEHSTHVIDPLPWSYPEDLLTHWNFRGARVSMVVPGACTYSAITSAMVGLGMPDHDTYKHADERHSLLRHCQSPLYGLVPAASLHRSIACCSFAQPFGASSTASGACTGAIVSLSAVCLPVRIALMWSG